jgi:hypothetical protein
MKYILKHQNRNYQININIPFDNFKNGAIKNNDIITLFNEDGTFAGTVGAEFLEECKIYGNDIMIPIENVTEEECGQGFLAIEYPFEREKVLEILQGMEIKFNSDTNDAIEYFVTEKPEEFLTNYRNTTYTNGTFKYCNISEEKNKIIFLTTWGFLINPKKVDFALDGGIYTFRFSERYKMYFIPADTKSEYYKKYK